MSAEKLNGRVNWGRVVDRVVVTGEQLMKEWRGALRRVNLPGVPDAFINITSSLHRGAFKGYQVEAYITKLEPLTDQEQGDLARQASEKAWARLERARKGDFS